TAQGAQHERGSRLQPTRRLDAGSDSGRGSGHHRVMAAGHHACARARCGAAGDRRARSAFGHDEACARRADTSPRPASTSESSSPPPPSTSPGSPNPANESRRGSLPIPRQSPPALRVTSPGSFTYSGSSGVRMLKRHLQHTLRESLRGGMARISTFMFGLYIFVVTIIDFGHVEWQFFSRMSGRPIDSHWSTATQRLNVMMPTSGSGISKLTSKAFPGMVVASIWEDSTY